MTAPRVKLDIDVIRETPIAVGLGQPADALDPLLAEAVQTQMPADVFLDRLLGRRTLRAKIGASRRC